MDSMLSKNTETKLTMAEKEAKRIQEENYKKAIEGGSVRKSKRLMSFSSQPRIKTNNMRRLYDLFWANKDGGDDNDDDVSGEIPSTNCVIGDSARSTGAVQCDDNDCSAFEKVERSDTDKQDVVCVEDESSADSYVKVSPRLKLKRIHCCPNIYTIENFVTAVELNYLCNKIKSANQKKLFKKSFIDDDIPASKMKSRKNFAYEKKNESRKRSKKSYDDQCNKHSNGAVMHVRDSCNAGDSSEKDTIDSSCSSTYNIDHDDDYDDENSYEQRTSQFIHFTKQSDSIITSIEQRACELLSLPNECIEPLQLVKYDVGQYFNIHHDLGILYDDGSVELPQRSNVLLTPPRRIVTILVYLNDVKPTYGGSTQFPLLKSRQQQNISNNNQKVLPTDVQRHDRKCLEIHPKKGMALVWCNITKDGLPDTRVVHSGQRLIASKEMSNKHEGATSTCSEQDKQDNFMSKSGDESSLIVKYAMNIWACEY